jgi:hypothetical protein
VASGKWRKACSKLNQSDCAQPENRSKFLQTKADVISRGGIAVVVRVFAEVLMDAGERCIGTLRSSA